MFPTQWVCRVFLCFSFVLSMFAMSMPGLAASEGDSADAELIERMSLDELVEQFSADTRMLAAYPILIMLDATEKFDVDLEELFMQETAHPEFEAYFLAQVESLDSVSDRLDMVFSRIIERTGADEFERLALGLPKFEFAMLLSMSGMIGDHYSSMDEGEPDVRQQLSERIKHSEMFQARMLDVLKVSEPMLELALTEDSLARLESAGMDQFLGMLFGGDSLGGSLLPVVLPKLSLDKALDFLVTAQNDARYGHLQDDLDHWIGTGRMAFMIDFPPDWLRERIEAGDLRWLTMLAGSDDDANLPLLIEHIDQLDRSRQLQLVAMRPDPALFHLLPVAWEEMVLEFACSGCELEEHGRSEIGVLGSALVNFDTPLSAGILDELLEFSMTRDDHELLQSLSSDMVLSGVDAYLKKAIDVLVSRPDLDLSYMQLNDIHESSPESAHHIAGARIDQWLDQTVEMLSGDHFYSWKVCDQLALLFYAHGQGLFQEWLELYLDIAAEEKHAEVMDMCSHQLVQTISTIKEPQALRSLVGAWLVSEVDDFWYRMLVSRINRLDDSQGDVLRETLLALLIDEPVWETLPEFQRDRLMGLIPIGGSGMSCRAPDDWDPEAGHEDSEFEIDSEEDRAGVE